LVESRYVEAVQDVVSVMAAYCMLLHVINPLEQEFPFKILHTCI